MEMDYNKIYNKILTDEEFMEIKQHGSSDYPFQYYYDNLELFDFHCIEWHWHREFEFLYVESGEVTCGIGEKQIILSEGEAIFINSKILHRFYAPSGGIIANSARTVRLFRNRRYIHSDLVVRVFCSKRYVFPLLL